MQVSGRAEKPRLKQMEKTLGSGLAGAEVSTSHSQQEGERSREAGTDTAAAACPQVWPEGMTARRISFNLSRLENCGAVGE